MTPQEARPEPVVEELDDDECRRLLQTQTVGRLAVAVPGAAPHVVPVNYTTLRGSIVFRSAPGLKLEMLVDEPVSFEVDWWDEERRQGWSVLAQGLAYGASDWEIEVEDVALAPFVDRPQDHAAIAAGVAPRTLNPPGPSSPMIGQPVDGRAYATRPSPAPRLVYGPTAVRTKAPRDRPASVVISVAPRTSMPAIRATPTEFPRTAWGRRRPRWPSPRRRCPASRT